MVWFISCVFSHVSFGIRISNKCRTTNTIVKILFLCIGFHVLLSKCFSGCKKFGNHARSGRQKNIDSEAVLQTIEANPTSRTRRVSDKLSICDSVMFFTFMSSPKAFSAAEWCLKLVKVNKAGNLSQGWPDGSLFKSYYTEV